ncbi:MAG: MarR family transcriptional regulator [Solirubrobacterales bacterium]|nr:MarR family transcriptional regulator [Solirubrobacterales bacterium]
MRPKPRRATATAIPRAPRGQRREELLAEIKASPGATPADLAKKIGIRPGQVHGMIGKARAENLIVKKDAGYALKKK